VLRERCSDGVTSGVARVLPEPILTLYSERGAPNSERHSDPATTPEEYGAAIGSFPCRGAQVHR
jgi:hypothetical protein